MSFSIDTDTSQVSDDSGCSVVHSMMVPTAGEEARRRRSEMGVVSLGDAVMTDDTARRPPKPSVILTPLLRSS